MKPWCYRCSCDADVCGSPLGGGYAVWLDADMVAALAAYRRRELGARKESLQDALRALLLERKADS